MVVLIIMKFFELGPFSDKYVERDASSMRIAQPKIEVDLLTVNSYSRPGTQSSKIRNIVIHYTANPGTGAEQNRNYFEGLKDSKKTKASSHFIVGLEGEIVQCVPTWEIAYASNDRNSDSVSIETCHLKSDGAYTDATYDSLVHLTAWLCEKFGLTEEDIIRHYDITGKICPKYFVDNEEAWKQFKLDVKETLEEK
jgi:N-acetylmuramoyl-L-alanine amidase CwlA